MSGVDYTCFSAVMTDSFTKIAGRPVAGSRVGMNCSWCQGTPWHRELNTPLRAAAAATAADPGPLWQGRVTASLPGSCNRSFVSVDKFSFQPKIFFFLLVFRERGQLNQTNDTSDAPMMLAG